MDVTAIERLNERQRQILRLYFRQLEAKEIARELGISPHTVNDHLRTARRLLGVSRSIQAARILELYEARNRLGTEPIGIGAEVTPSHDESAVAPEHSVAIVRRNRYRLSSLARIALIILIAFGAGALAGAMLETVHALTSLLRSEHIDLSEIH